MASKGDGNMRKPRGLAAVSPEKRRQIASLGGKASPMNFKLDPARASIEGKKGGRPRK